MNTTFIINGGAGRVIAAVPALEKFAKLNPADDFSVLVYGWESLFWSHPILQNRTFSIGQKGIFDQLIKNNKVVCPEPYYINDYYNQKISLAEAFDLEINSATKIPALKKPNLYLSSAEKNTAKKLIADKLQEFGKKRTVVIQPYGSGIGIVNNRPYDSSHRSMDVDGYLSLVNQLTKINNDLLIVYFGDPQYKHPGDSSSISLAPTADLRSYMAIIEQCDYFVGCDSVGQHMARALNKQGLVLMGSTSEINVSYPEHFKFYRIPGRKPVYSPIRVSGIDCEFADRSNDGIMNFNQTQIEEIAKIVNRSLYE